MDVHHHPLGLKNNMLRKGPKKRNTLRKRNLDLLSRIVLVRVCTTIAIFPVI